jgi:nitrogen regulatory protein P-II 1
MKKIEAVVRVEKIDAVVDALHALNAPGMMLTRIEGHGRQKGIVEQFRGRQYRVDLLPKAKFELVVHDADVAKFVAAITEAAKTGEVGDGKDFRSDDGECAPHPDRGAGIGAVGDWAGPGAPPLC